jgi:hypothetical protein
MSTCARLRTSVLTTAPTAWPLVKRKTGGHKRPIGGIQLKKLLFYSVRFHLRGSRHLPEQFYPTEYSFFAILLFLAG